MSNNKLLELCSPLIGFSDAFEVRPNNNSIEIENPHVIVYDDESAVVKERVEIPEPYDMQLDCDEVSGNGMWCFMCRSVQWDGEEVVQCEFCHTWQHEACVNYEMETQYTCRLCQLAMNFNARFFFTDVCALGH